MAALAHPQVPTGRAVPRFCDVPSGSFIGARTVRGITSLFGTTFTPDGLRWVVGLGVAAGPVPDGCKGARRPRPGLKT